MKNHTLKLFVALMLCAITISSCKKDDEGDPIENADFTGGVLTGNEGQFQVGNSEIDFYQPNSRKTQNKIFNGVNKRPLGDIFQSFSLVGDNLYLIVNNSKKIEVVNRKTFSSVGAIDNLNSPRFMISVGGNKAYVSNLFGTTVDIINTSTNSKTGSITIGGGSDRMVLYNGKAVVGNTSDSMIYFIDPTTDQKVDSMKVGRAPSEFLVDNNNKIWVLCKGFYNSTTQVMEGISLHLCEMVNKTSVMSYTFPDGSSPAFMSYNKNRNKIFFLNGSLYHFDVSSSPIAPQKFNNDNSYYYGFGIDPQNDDIYLANPKDFTQNGFVKRLDIGGNQLDSFPVSVAPSSFFFNY